MSNVLIVSHVADLDGVASALLACNYISETRGIVPKVSFADYDDAFEIVIEAARGMDEVWICDLSWKITNIGLIDHLAHISPDRLMFFDHHRSSRECFDAWQNQATFFFDDSGIVCATDLVWQYINDRGYSPENLIPIVSAAHSRDLWIRNDPNGCEISSVIDELGALSVFESLSNDLSLIQISNFPSEWRVICKSAKRKIEKSYLIARNTMTRTSALALDGESIPVMACISMGCISEVGERILLEEGLGFIGFIDLDHGGLSFRTTFPTIDKMGFGVDEIASRIHPNGGGHPVASGAADNVYYLTNGSNALLGVMIAAIIDYQETSLKSESDCHNNSERL